MKYVKHFEDYKEEDIIHNLMRVNLITKYVINSDLSVDIDQDVYFTGSKFKNNRLPIKINKINGWFDLSNCGLTTLDGCPEYVSGYFNCVGNKLTDLKGGPKIVNSDYLCDNNDIKTLDGIAEYIGGDLIICNNPITELDFLPKHIFGAFDCSSTKIKNLIGCPEYVDSYFNATGCGMTSLVGTYKRIGGSLDVSGNELTNLVGICKSINGTNIFVKNNKLVSFKGLDKDNRIELWYASNPIDSRIYLDMDKEERDKILNNMYEYDIWLDDGLNVPRFNLLLDDIKNGVI